MSSVYNMLVSLQVLYIECSGDICQWSSNLYPCFVHRLIVPEGLWEIIGWGKQRAPAADEHSLTHSTGINPTAGFSASYSRQHTALCMTGFAGFKIIQINLSVHWLTLKMSHDQRTQLHLSIMFFYNGLFSPASLWQARKCITHIVLDDWKNWALYTKLYLWQNIIACILRWPGE